MTNADAPACAANDPAVTFALVAPVGLQMVVHTVAANEGLHPVPDVATHGLRNWTPLDYTLTLTSRAGYHAGAFAGHAHGDTSLQLGSSPMEELGLQGID